MRVSNILACQIASLAAVAIASTPARTVAVEVASQALVDAGSELYQGRCANCHSNEPGKTIFAPTLFGLIGRKAGGVEGFPYSEKITHLDLVWAPDSLGAWLQSSSLDSALLRMRHLGVEDAQDRAALIAYIASLKP